MEKVVKVNVMTIGSSGVGKSSIIKRIKDGVFDEFTQTTIGMGYSTINRKYEQKNLTICINFLDTMGLENYQDIIPPQHIRNSQIALLVFDSLKTLDDLIEKWYRFLKENNNNNSLRFILVGNKSDIFDDEKEEIIKNGEKFAEEINAQFITCSAKSKDNMDNLERFIINEAKGLIDELEKTVNIKNSIDIRNIHNNSFGIQNIHNKHNTHSNKNGNGCSC